MTKTAAAIVLGIFLISGCATIIGDKTQLLGVTSQPGGARVSIADETGKVIFEGQTPTNVTLEKSNGSYWGGKSYVVQISKEGFETQSIPIHTHANGWYIAGNFIFGGLIGWFIVDPLNGAMYTLSPEKIDSRLGQKAAHNNRGDGSRIAILLLQDVPASLHDKMVKIGN
jgi:hypothetical protein